jgi:hypothetical protein
MFIMLSALVAFAFPPALLTSTIRLVTVPHYSRVLGKQVGAQQVVPITQFRFL